MRFRNLPALLILSWPFLSFESCIHEKETFFVGECADYPEGDYLFGEIGIGTCLAGVSDLFVLSGSGDGGGPYLGILNSNHELYFSSGSLLLIDLDSLDLEQPFNLSHELTSHVLETPPFCARVVHDSSQDLLFISSRETPGSIVTTENDFIYVVDIENPENPVFYDGTTDPEGEWNRVEVGADPYGMAFDPETGLLYVANMSGESVSVVDTTTTPMEALDILGSSVKVDDIYFINSDDIPSLAGIENISFYSAAWRENWKATYYEGTFRLFYTSAGRMGRGDSEGGAFFRKSSSNPELEGDEGEWDENGIDSISPLLLEGGMILYYGAVIEERGYIGYAQYEGGMEWEKGDTYILGPGEDGDFDSEGLFDPHVITEGGEYHLFYTAYDGEVYSIGHALSGDGTSFEKDEEPILYPSDEGWDSSAIYQPHALYDEGEGLFYLYYAGDGGGYPAIGLATSEDGESFERYSGSPVLEKGGEGEWDAEGVSNPSVLKDYGQFKLWYTGFDQGISGVGYGWSRDGKAFTRLSSNPVVTGGTAGTWDDEGISSFKVVKLTTGNRWKAEGSLSGLQSNIVENNEIWIDDEATFSFTIVAGHIFGLGELDGWEDEGVIEPFLYATEEGGEMEYTMLYAGYDGSLFSIGSAESSDGMAWERAADDPILEPAGDAWDSEMVRSPSLLTGKDGEYLLYYEGTGQDGISGIGLARGSDLENLERYSIPILQEGEEGEWDSQGVGDPSVIIVGDTYHLFYTGRDTSSSRIGLALSTNERDFEKYYAGGSPEEGYIIGTGSGSDFDTSSVYAPSVLYDPDEGIFRAWYTGSGRGKVSIGYASSEDGYQWTKYTEDGVCVPVLEGEEGSWDEDGVSEPHVVKEGGIFRAYFTGYNGEYFRIGYAESEDGTEWKKYFLPPTSGDYFTFSVSPADDEEPTNILLSQTYGDEVFSGTGASEIRLIQDQGFAVVSSKSSPALWILDVRDDSDIYYRDINYHDIETVMVVENNAGAGGMRDIFLSSDGFTLHALNDDPEALLTFDLSFLEDNDEVEIVEDGLIGFNPLARGSERDRGLVSDANVGPGRFIFTRDETRVYVSNFNDNSIYVFDFTLSPLGVLVDIIRGIGENPYAMVFSPDGKYLFVGCYHGFMDKDGILHSTIVVIDTDPESPDYHRILTRISNVEEE